MKIRNIALAAVAAAASLASAGAAHATNTLQATYFSVSESTGIGTGGDFGTCCSSPPATLENINVGDTLSGGLPVDNGGNVVSKNGSGQILWWTPGNGVTATGSGVFTADGGLYSMYAPNSTGTNNTNYFQTTILKGTLTGTGSDVKLTVGGDDDVLVYVNGAYVGGVPGVHGTTYTTLDLGVVSGSESVHVFYADRAQVGANLSISLTGGSITGVPEVSTWVMMLAGFAGLGFVGYRRNKAAILAA